MAANLATQTKKCMKWEEKYENVLIELWEENMDALRSQQRNSHIYARIAEQLKLHGLSEVSGKDVKTKVDNMSRKFRVEMKITGPSGGAPSKWKHFDRLKRFLGCVKSINPIAFESTEDDGGAKEPPEFIMIDEDAMDSGIISGASSSNMKRSLSYGSSLSLDEPSCSRASSRPPSGASDIITPNKRRKLAKQTESAFHEELLEQNMERNAALVSIAESQLKAVEGLKQVMEKLAESTAKFQEEVLKKL